jgi:hypothetical protein
MFATLPLDDLFAKAPVLYQGARDTSEIAQVLADDYEYAPEDYAQGLALVDEAKQKSADQVREKREAVEATEAAQAAAKAVRKVFVAHRRLARTKIKRDDARYGGLGLGDDVPRDRAGLLRMSEEFYRALLDDATPVEGVRGLRQPALQRGLTLTEEARAADAAQQREAAESTDATETRDDAVQRLRDHASELSEVAKVAFADRPTLLNNLGL